MFKMNSLMVLEYFDNGLVYKKIFEYNVIVSLIIFGILYMFYDKIFFFLEKIRRGLENVWRNWSMIELNFVKIISLVEVYVYVYY